MGTSPGKFDSCRPDHLNGEPAGAALCFANTDGVGSLPTLSTNSCSDRQQADHSPSKCEMLTARIRLGVRSASSVVERGSRTADVRGPIPPAEHHAVVAQQEEPCLVSRMIGVRGLASAPFHPLVAQLVEVTRLERVGWQFESSPRGPIHADIGQWQTAILVRSMTMVRFHLSAPFNGSARKALALIRPAALGQVQPLSPIHGRWRWTQEGLINPASSR